jgi:hypothetical protein
MFYNRDVSISKNINKNSWQAVFLTNNQVYFGILDYYNEQYLRLTKVYYLQSNQDMGDKTKDNSEINLIKLGVEIHGPEDIMYISQNQVLFWENLKSDSRIVNIIKNNK